MNNIPAAPAPPHMLTLCPYLLKPIADLAEVDEEHIIPHAMGGSNQFVLPVDKPSNSAFGMTVDSDLIHDPRLRFMAASQGIKSRTGDVTIELPGVIVETGMKVLVPFNKNGLGQARVMDVYKRDPITNKLTGIAGFDDQINSTLQRLSKRGEKKWEIASRSRIDQPVVKVEFPSDPFKVSKGLCKIAYLMACRTLGDSFALSADATAFRIAIHAKDFAAFDSCGLQLFFAAELPLLVLPNLTAAQHLVACFRVNDLMMVAVKLFGSVVVSTFGFPARSNLVRPLDGIVVINDNRTRTHTEKGLQEITSVDEMVRRMVAYKERQDASKGDHAHRGEEASGWSTASSLSARLLA
ncbi:HNH endonuclease [Caballeronia sp. SEWSISQ10-4 2]|uniref:hypothetical protein n=1 Tax=Caballeronia sp. SEWSISQ10-4 2 TaxID=2937438 RepID=UPI002652DF3D|nr:hypothetical protein [Caballeronia sp. SEWSISQ10-4 2]MDN7176965.1 HNH endonuclease [Caballeronia sp. SEWSISQ10-4 2]